MLQSNRANADAAIVTEPGPFQTVDEQVSDSVLEVLREGRLFVAVLS
ncbi:MAG: hypothetical protein ACKVH8_25095 [Pirellulales bacterium]|jgi:hypothetical protein